jgi:hypothetical protein
LNDSPKSSKKGPSESSSSGDNESGSPDEDVKKDKVGLVNQPHCNGLIDEIPDWQKDNEFILTGYRVKYQGCGNVSRTFCKWHNESMNVWSHCIGFLMFSTAIIYVLATQPNMYRQGKSAVKDFLEDNKLNEISLDLFTLDKFNFLNSKLSEAQ